MISDLEEKDQDKLFDFRIFVTGDLTDNQIMNIALERESNELRAATCSYDTVTGLLSPTQFGRPNFRREFSQIALSNPSASFDVYFCGPIPMSHSLKLICTDFKFNFYSESFN